MVVESRQFELSEDLYQIRSKEKVHIFEELVPMRSEKAIDESDLLNKLEVTKDEDHKV